jgi:hypothetical protein
MHWKHARERGEDALMKMGKLKMVKRRWIQAWDI